MIHQRQRLPFGLKPGNDAFGVHPRLDDLQGHAPVNRLFLFGHEDHAAAAFADLLQQLVAAHAIAGLFSGGRHGSAWRRGLVGGMFQEIPDLLMPIEQDLDTPAQFIVATASALQKGSAFAHGQLQRFGEECHVSIGGIIHQIMRIVPDVTLQIKRKEVGCSSRIFIKLPFSAISLNKCRSSVLDNKATFNPQ